MTDLLSALPNFSTAEYSHLLPNLERSQVTVSDLLTLDCIDIAKHAQIPARQVKRLVDHILRSLHNDLDLVDGSGSGPGPGRTNSAVASPRRIAHTISEPRWNAVSTLDDGVDAALGGGFPAGYLSEITGESAAGKTQLLYTLLLSVQLQSHDSTGRAALYISTEGPLQTPRLDQLIKSHPRLSPLPENQKPSLNRVLSIQTHDVESQDHILRYQVPLAIQRHNIGLIVLDSVTANFRAEYERRDKREGRDSMARRSSQLMEMGQFLRDLARDQHVAVVVANQVADRFTPEPISTPFASQSFSASQRMTEHDGGDTIEGADDAHRLMNSQHESLFAAQDPMTLDHQQRWFTGWGDADEELGGFLDLKTPSLGMVWVNQIACRVALLRGRDRSSVQGGRKRWMKVVFAPWMRHDLETGGIEFRIDASGLSSANRMHESKDTKQ